MSRDEIFARIRDYLLRAFPADGVELDGSTLLLDEWFVDSVAIVNTVLFLESSFGVSMGRADINATVFRSLDSLTDYVERSLAEGP